MTIERTNIDEKPIPTLSDGEPDINQDHIDSMIEAENKRKEQIHDELALLLAQQDITFWDKLKFVLENGGIFIKIAYYLVLIFIKIKGLK